MSLAGRSQPHGCWHRPYFGPSFGQIERSTQNRRDPASACEAQPDSACKAVHLLLSPQQPESTHRESAATGSLLCRHAGGIGDGRRALSQRHPARREQCAEAHRAATQVQIVRAHRRPSAPDAGSDRSPARRDRDLRPHRNIQPGRPGNARRQIGAAGGLHRPRS